MGVRLNRIETYKPAVYVDRSGKEFTKMPGAPRKIPQEVRAQIYELDRTIHESKQEINRLLTECGCVEGASRRAYFVSRIRQERGR